MKGETITMLSDVTIVESPLVPDGKLFNIGTGFPTWLVSTNKLTQPLWMLGPIDQATPIWMQLVLDRLAARRAKRIRFGLGDPLKVADISGADCPKPDSGFRFGGERP